MAYDATRQRVVLFGGNSGGDRNDTWEWDGIDWVQRDADNPPSPRVYSAMAYDRGRERLVVFGGDGVSGMLNDVWEMRQSDVARYNTFGAGCPGWAGVPYLATDGGVPSLGRFFHVYARNLPPDHSAMMWIGTSRSETYGFAIDSMSWKKIESDQTPPARIDASMTFAQGVLMLFGGRDSNLKQKGDNWKLVADQWKRWL